MVKQLSLFELSLDSTRYVGLPATDELPCRLPVGLWFLAVGLFLGLKLKISQEQNVLPFNFTYACQISGFSVQ